MVRFMSRTLVPRQYKADLHSPLPDRDQVDLGPLEQTIGPENIAETLSWKWKDFEKDGHERCSETHVLGAGSYRPPVGFS